MITKAKIYQYPKGETYLTISEFEKEITIRLKTGYYVHLDKRCIPQLIRILQQVEVK
jgi:hypothetical protein